MFMTTFKKAICTFLISFIFIIVIPIIILIGKFPDGFAVASAVIGGGGYMFWSLIFSCPQCHEPLLWDVQNGLKIVRLFPPKECKKCGCSTLTKIRKN